MAHQITFGAEQVRANNMQFSRLFGFAIAVGEGSCRTPADRGHVARMQKLVEEEFWPGRDVELETDFPELAERKFWSRVFYDTARAIFDHKVGVHDHSFWQAQCIWQAFGMGCLFEHAVRSVEPQWSAPSVDRVEFDRVVNGREPDPE